MKSSKSGKIMALLVIVAILAVFAAGCGGAKAEGTAGTEALTTATTAETTVPATEASKKDVKLVIWHYMNDREQLMNDFATQFEKDTGIKVENQLYTGDVFKEKQQAAAAAGQLPDAWNFSGGVGDICKYADSGDLLTVDDYLKEWGDNRFTDSILGLMEVTETTRSQTQNNKNAPLGNYMIPLDVNNMQYLYNKDLFAKAGLDPEITPKTWAEFIDMGKRLKAAGIIPFAAGVGSWVQMSMCSDFQFEFMGADNINKARQAQMTFKDAGLESALNEFVEMRDAKMFADGSATMDCPTAEQLFVNGKVAMLYDGSWALGVFKGMNPDFKNFGIFPTPKDERAKFDVRIPGGPGSFFVINAKGKNIKETMDYMKFITDKPQQVKYSNESLNLPANNTLTDADKLAPQLLQFSQAMNLTQPAVAGERASIADLYGKGISMIINGDKTPAGLVKDMDDNNNKN